MSGINPVNNVAPQTKTQTKAHQKNEFNKLEYPYTLKQFKTNQALGSVVGGGLMGLIIGGIAKKTKSTKSAVIGIASGIAIATISLIKGFNSHYDARYAIKKQEFNYKQAIMQTKLDKAQEKQT